MSVLRKLGKMGSELFEMLFVVNEMTLCIFLLILTIYQELMKWKERRGAKAL